MSASATVHRTADICDAHGEAVRVCEPVLSDFGGRTLFHGIVVTVRSVEDNARLKALLQTPGDGCVVVVDGGGSTARALVGGNVARMAAANGWAGLVINGCVRDRHEIAEAKLGVKALGSCPRRPKQDGAGAEGVPVTFAGVTFSPGDYLYADGDGVVVAARQLVD